MPNPPRPPVKRPPGKGGKQIAGIPLMWWVIGGGAAVGVIYYSYKRTATATTAPVATDPTLADPNAQMYGDPSYAAYGDSSGIAYSGYQGTTPVQTQTTNTIDIHEAPVATNADWYVHAVKALSGHGYTRHIVVTALSEYLLGLPLYPHQIAVVEAAVHKVGPPPTRVPIHRRPEPKRPKPPPRKKR